MAFLFRCPQCRTRRRSHKLFTAHLRSTGHRLCRCGGYHYSHRRGSPYCYENPVSPIYHADRQGNNEETLLRVAASIVRDAPELADKVKDVCAHLGLNLQSLKELHDGNEIV